jgi:hypothetical protein
MSFFSFFFYKIREQEGGSGPAGLAGGGGTSKRWWGEGVGGWIWYKYCVHMYVNIKRKSVETILGMGEGKGEW